MVFNNSLFICTAVTTCRVYRPILLSRQIGIVVPASLGIVAKQHTKKWCCNVSDWLMTSQSARWITQTNENIGISFNFQLKHTFFFKTRSLFIENFKQKTTTLKKTRAICNPRLHNHLYEMKYIHKSINFCWLVTRDGRASSLALISNFQMQFLCKSLHWSQVLVSLGNHMWTRWVCERYVYKMIILSN